MMKFIKSIFSPVKWVASFFQDSSGKGSRHGAVLYICMFFLYKMVEANINDTLYKPDQMILLVIVLTILFLIGAINKSVITDLLGKKSTDKKTE